MVVVAGDGFNRGLRVRQSARAGDARSPRGSTWVRVRSGALAFIGGGVGAVAAADVLLRVGGALGGGLEVVAAAAGEGAFDEGGLAFEAVEGAVAGVGGALARGAGGAVDGAAGAGGLAGGLAGLEGGGVGGVFGAGAAGAAGG